MKVLETAGFLMFHKDKEKDNNTCVGTASISFAIRKKGKVI